MSDLTPEQLYYCALSIDNRPLMDVAMYGATILLGHAIVVSGSNWPVEDYPPDRRSSRIIRPASEAELVASLGTLLAQVDELVVRFSDGDLAREVTFPLVSSKQMDALSVDFTHALTYVGAITGIRAIGGSPIPPGH